AEAHPRLGKELRATVVGPVRPARPRTRRSQGEGGRTMTTSSRAATLTLPTDEQILITREFDAPRHLVFKAFTTPELVKRWWHANRGEVTECEIDLRVGGQWRYAMVTPDGFEVAFHGEYLELVPDELVVSTETYEGLPEGVSDEDGSTVNTATFAE